MLCLSGDLKVPRTGNTHKVIPQDELNANKRVEPIHANPLSTKFLSSVGDEFSYLFSIYCVVAGSWVSNCGTRLVLKMNLFGQIHRMYF